MTLSKKELKLKVYKKRSTSPITLYRYGVRSPECIIAYNNYMRKYMRRRRQRQRQQQRDS